jgi:hypothetical protein
MPAKDRVSYFYDGERFSYVISLELVHVVTGAQFLEVEVFWRRRRGVCNFSSFAFSFELYIFGSLKIVIDGL